MANMNGIKVESIRIECKNNLGGKPVYVVEELMTQEGHEAATALIQAVGASHPILAADVQEALARVPSPGQWLVHYKTKNYEVARNCLKTLRKQMPEREFRLRGE